MERYESVCGQPYKCDIKGCDCRAKWRLTISNTKTLLLCDAHKAENESKG